MSLVIHLPLVKLVAKQLNTDEPYVPGAASGCWWPDEEPYVLAPMFTVDKTKSKCAEY